MISKYFSKAECTRSSTAARLGISNEPDQATWMRIKLLMTFVMDRIREATAPIVPNSVYRSPAVNAKVPGSAKTSQHMVGEACDFLPNGWTVNNTIKKILELNIPFDQLIDEYGQWVHISYSSQRPNRGQILRYRKISGKLHITKLDRKDFIA